MQVQSTNPFSNFKINFKGSGKDILPCEDQNSDKTKTVIIIDYPTLLAMTNINKTPDEVKTTFNEFITTSEAAKSLTKTVKKESNEVFSEAQKVYNKVMELFQKGNEIADDGTVLRKITTSDNKKIMEEFNQDGSLFRKSTLENGLLHIEEGIEEFTDSSKRVARTYNFFENEKSITYDEDYRIFANGLEQTAKTMHFKQGKLNLYTQDYELYADGSEKTAKILRIENGQPVLYNEGKKFSRDTMQWQTAKSLFFPFTLNMKY